MSATTSIAVPRLPGADDLPPGHGVHEHRSRRRDRRTFWALAAPGLLGLAVTYLLPLLYMVRMAFNRGKPDGFIEQTFTLDTLIKPLTDSYYWKVTLDTFLMGLVVAAICVVISYPLALFLTRSTSRYKSLLIALAIAPLLTSAVVRTYGWMVILGGAGLVNSTLMHLGLVTVPLRLTNNMTGVVIGLVEIFMPYAILVMMSGFGRLDPRLEEAAASLGARPRAVFARITLPLTLPALLSAFLLIFVLSISSFITTNLLGGGAVHVLATEIYDQATGLLNWPFAAALSVILLVLFGVVIAIYQTVTRRLRLDA